MVTEHRPWLKMPGQRPRQVAFDGHVKAYARLSHAIAPASQVRGTWRFLGTSKFTPAFKEHDELRYPLDALVASWMAAFVSPRNNHVLCIFALARPCPFRGLALLLTELRSGARAA